MSILLTAALGGAAIGGLAALKKRQEKNNTGFFGRLEHKRDMQQAQRTQEKEDVDRLDDVKDAQNRWQGFNNAQVEQMTGQLNQGAGAQIQAQQMGAAQAGLANNPGMLYALQNKIGGQMGDLQAKNSQAVMGASQAQDASVKEGLAAEEQMLRGSILGGFDREMAAGMSQQQKMQLAGGTAQAGAQLLPYILPAAAAACWVADELWGTTHRFTGYARYWCLSHLTNPFCRVYTKRGEGWAAWLHKRSWGALLARPFAHLLWSVLALLGYLHLTARLKEVRHG